MKKKLVLLLVLFLASTALAPYRARYGPTLDWFNVEKKANALIISPDDNIQDKYDWLKSSDRDAVMGALSATNWRCLVLTPGRYIPSDSLTLDTDYIAVVSMAPGAPEATILDVNAAKPTLIQTTNIVFLSSFTVYNSNTTRKQPSQFATSAMGFKMDAADNSDSTYRFMKFNVVNEGPKPGPPPVEFGLGIYVVDKDFNGTWEYCSSGDHSFRIWETTAARGFGATMRNCTGGEDSFIGDKADHVTVTGKFYGCVAEDQSFGGCSAFGVPLSSDAYFEDCVAGDRSYGLGEAVAATFKRCVGGTSCFGGYVSGAYYPDFSGYAENCIAEGRSFGSGHASAKNTGELVNCTMEGMPVAMHCEGATIRNCRLTVTTTDIDCLVLEDGNSEIYNTDIMVYSGGTGIPVDAGSAYDVIVSHCRMNNAANDEDGLGSNVTNLVAGNNIVKGADVYPLIKTVIKTIDVDDDASTDDFQFDDDASNQTEQPVNLGAIIPAYAEVVSVQLRCFETVTGSAAMSIDLGTASGGAELLAAANIDTANDIDGTATGAGPKLEAANSAKSVWINATPDADWDALDAGRWAVMVTYIDYGAVYTTDSP